MKTKVPYNELVMAYKQGQRAKRSGALLFDNPYPVQSKSRSHDAHSSWIRGWLSERVRS